MGQSKRFVPPPKKQKAKTVLETASDYQEAADREEEAGGKHRVGDPAKSARAFLRALDVYDTALRRYPSNFDLAYNKARLELEITQQPALVEHIGLPLIDLLVQTLESHRVAVKLNEENPDALFNTAQVLITLSEQVAESDRTREAVSLLQESLELLSSCLSRQEMLLEQQNAAMEDFETGGVSLEPEEKPASLSVSEASEQSASIETPTTATDLLDTVHASLSALTTLISIVEPQSLQMYADMAQSLIEGKAPSYFALLAIDEQGPARLAISIDRAIFVAAFADAQYTFSLIELETYMERLAAFEIPSKDSSAHALSSEAEARTTLAQSVSDRFVSSPASLPADTCWKQLTLAQELHTKATKLIDSDAKERQPEIYESKGNVELLRHRIATMPDVALSKGIKASATTLIQNAQTFYKGAAHLARASGDSELETKAKQRWLVATDIGELLYGVQPKHSSPFEGNSEVARADLVAAVRECIDEGLIDGKLGEEVVKRMQRP